MHDESLPRSGWYCPSVHVVHFDFVDCVWNCPRSHKIHDESLCVEFWNWPGSHVMHALCAPWSWYSPRAQAMQEESLPSSGCAVHDSNQS